MRYMILFMIKYYFGFIFIEFIQFSHIFFLFNLVLIFIDFIQFDFFVNVV